ncbi:TPA: RNA-binding protein [Streptococcus agalactiae]|nr:RNA-binding protein [Streptococcus agalactiae]
MSFISWLTIIFAGFLYLALWISETIEKQKQAKILRLNLPAIVADLEQVIEMTSSVANTKLLFDSRYVRYLNSSQHQDCHLVSFPIMVGKEIKDEEVNYLSQVFLTQFSKYLTKSTTYESWSDKGKSLSVMPQFGKLLRYNNQYYLNLEVQFSYSSN